MKILTVSPIQKTILKNDFSYFTNLKNLNIGDIIEVPIRTKKVPAVILKIKDIKDVKTNLRNQNFTLKKLNNNVTSKKLFTEAFTQTTDEISKFFVGTQGQVINQFVPKDFILYYKNLSNKKIYRTSDKQNKKNNRTKNKDRVLIADKENRINFYEKLIKKNLKENKSILFYFPTTGLVNHFYKNLNTNSNERIFKFHSKINKKLLQKNILQCLSEKKSVVIFATSNFSSLPRNDIKTFIIENFSEEEIKISKPFTNVQKFFENFAKNSNAEILFGDSFFTPKILRKIQANEVELIEIKNYPNQQKATLNIIDQKNKKVEKLSSPSPHVLNKYLFLDEQVLSNLKKLYESKEKGLVLVSRKGIASYTACADCGTSVQCVNCHSPLSLKKQGESNKFFCSRCNKFFNTEVRCALCYSWNLKSYGIGLDKIKKEIEENVLGIKVFAFSKDHLKTEAQIREVLNQFSSHKKASVLLGTEMLLSHFEDKVPYSLVASNDSLFYLPNYKNEERYFNQVMKLQEKTIRNIDVQTRCSEKPLFKYLKKADSKSFSKSELSLRKNFGYPPYKIIIKLELSGKRTKIIKDNEYLRGVLYEYRPETISGKKTGSSDYFVTTFITTEPKLWPDKKLSAILYSLPSNVTISVSL